MDSRESTVPAPSEAIRECFACYDGTVFIGHVVEDSEAGEEVEVFEAVPCRRCSNKSWLPVL
jgi:hypothetical protein